MGERTNPPIGSVYIATCIGPFFRPVFLLPIPSPLSSSPTVRCARTRTHIHTRFVLCVLCLPEPFSCASCIFCCGPYPFPFLARFDGHETGFLRPLVDLLGNDPRRPIATGKTTPSTQPTHSPSFQSPSLPGQAASHPSPLRFLHPPMVTIDQFDG